MIQIYFIIGAIVGLIFALGAIFLSIFYKDDLMKIVNKNNMPFGNHATILTIAVLVNILLWPVIMIYLGKRYWTLKQS